MSDREPRPTDLMGARDISNEWGIPLRTAENILRVVAREHDGRLLRDDQNRSHQGVLS